MRKDARLSIAFSVRQCALVREAARRDGTTVSEFIRLSALAAAARTECNGLVTGASGALRGLVRNSTIGRSARLVSAPVNETY